jgi:hypothetical protein
MTNAEEYRFRDFTIKNYRKILEACLVNYDFIYFTDVMTEGKKQIILRHDVEFSVPIALTMAEIEASMGIPATYFIQLHGDFYNVLEKGNFNAITKIKALGHQIGLHFDPHFWEIDSEAGLEGAIEKEKRVMKLYFGFEPEVFSFHNTNPFILSCEEEKYAGLINVYSKKYKTSVGYCSDSTGYWRYEVLEERIHAVADEKLQILIHDGMWQEEVLPPRKRVYKVIEDQAELLKRSYDATLKNFGAKNIDWDEIL